MTLQNHPDPFYWLAALRLPTIGVKSLHAVLTHAGSLSFLFTADKTELQAVGLTAKQIAHIQQVDWDAVERDYRWCEQHSCAIITLLDPAYPPLLRETADAPLVLFVQGVHDLLLAPQLAMVGSRHPTPGGCEIARQFAETLSKSGLTITSGLALGIDACSHRGALQGQGKTIAVLGTGLNVIYPRSHRRLAEAIVAEGGALVSEFLPWEPAKAANFPRRNRIISGLSVGVLVVEAAVRSGSLITARFAVEQGREVFAIPGSIYNPLARGCHQLLKQGAKLVETALDVIEELGALVMLCQPLAAAKQLHAEPTDQQSRQVLRQVGYETTSTDAIILRSGLTASEVSSMLLSLELAGFIQTVPGGYTRVLTGK